MKDEDKTVAVKKKKEKGKTVSDGQIQNYIGEPLQFLEAMNWDYGRRNKEESIGESHTFKHLYVALSLIKQDLDYIVQERDEAECNIAEQDKFNELRAEIWKIASDKSLEEDVMIQKLLDKVGPAIGMSRACYNKYTEEEPDKKDMACILEWCDEGVKPSVGTKMPDFLVNNFIHDNFFILTPETALEMLPEPLRAVGKPVIDTLAKSLNLESVLAVPYYIDGKTEGLLTFDICKDKKEKTSWTEDMNRIVNELVTIVSNHIAQKKTAEALQKAYEDMEARVEERTAEVSRAYEQLQQNLIERKRTEEKQQRNAEYLNVMNQELIAAKETLMVLNQELEQKVKERTAKIEKLLKQKDEFIGQLGHDLKTPLTPLLGLLPMVEKREKDPKSKEMLEVAVHSANYMKDLIVKTLQLARLTSPDVELLIEDINLLQEANNVIERVKFTVRKKGIKVENKINDKIIVKADKLRLEELFSNLITNAIKFTPDGGTITLDAKKAKDSVTISVKDTGIGMSREQLEHVFEAFYKVDKTRHELESSGLGLSICRRIVEKHGGKIGAESPGTGKGTTFYFTIKSG